MLHRFKENVTYGIFKAANYSVFALSGKCAPLTSQLSTPYSIQSLVPAYCDTTRILPDSKGNSRILKLAVFSLCLQIICLSS